MPRRFFDPTRALVAQVLRAAHRGVTPDELIELAHGRADVLVAALVRAPAPVSTMTVWHRAATEGAEERIRAALAIVVGSA